MSIGKGLTMNRMLTNQVTRIGMLIVCLAPIMTGLSACSSLRQADQAITDSGLVAHWTFNSGDARDDSRNGHDGSVAGCILVDDAFGKQNSAYHFNGQDNYILVPPGDAFDFGAGPFTLSCWMKTTAKTGDGAQRDDLVTKGDATQRGFALSLEDNSMAFIYGWQQGFFGVTPVNDGKWHHLVAIRDSQGGVALYLDGRRERIGRTGFGGNVDPTGKDNVTTTDPLVIGKHGSIDESYFTGELDEIRIYDRALDESEVKRLYGRSGGAAPFASSNSASTPINSSHTKNLSSPSLIGSWRVTYTNGAIRSYIVTPDCAVKFLEEDRMGAIQQTPEILVRFDDSKLERWTFAGDHLSVEHWNPASNYPKNPPTETGIGIRDTKEQKRSHRDNDGLWHRVANTSWQWDGSSGETVLFGSDGYVQQSGWAARGLITKWTIVDCHTIVLRVEKGRDRDLYAILLFDDDFSSFAGYNFYGTRLGKSHHIK